ncbi:hypothetical protein SAMD00020551_0584 [Mesobacillus selenatarsenatis SF-1]|uniref:Uncharacterized protein n=1 Tax=Mesobacillus selenatarsenatis (strain DSM 18680 / JCM 14380 / FERM P-15431 / SF-1) TaxID=1321606 RepID=A0A0A8WXQ7_MESS1|nr:hypothetical protein SAMD00020551_0584 [Mesobacillus selenatarsenatis SF-1]
MHIWRLVEETWFSSTFKNRLLHHFGAIAESENQIGKAN